MNATAQAVPVATRFVDNGDGTITDTNSGLMWSKDSTSLKNVDHATAERLCAGLDLAGHTDWRLPTVEELFALADRTRHSPAIDTDSFPDTESDWYWTSTITAWSSDRAWVVGFDYGSVSSGHRLNYNACVRAVRSVPSGQ